MAAPPPLPSSAPPAWRSKGKSSPFPKSSSADHSPGPSPRPPKKPKRTESLPGNSAASRTFPLAAKETKGTDYRKMPLPNAPPPPVPNTPRPPIDHTQIKMYKYPHPDEKFTLSQLIEKHSKLFPFRVRVVKGFFGERGEDSAIAVDEVYNIHFVKKSKVVRIRDVVNDKYILPINSATKFGLIYSNPQITDENHVFETVEDVMNATPLPKVICALASYQCSDEKASFNRNDVFIVKEVQKSSGFLKRNKNMLKVLSVDTLEEKYLHRDAVGKFTVNPSLAKLYLLELLEYVESPIPCYARMYIDFEANEPLPDYLTSERVRIETQFVETSVITSPVFEDEEEDPFDNGIDKIVDIPISLEIEVSVIPPGEGDEDDDYESVLYTRTETLINGFDPSQAKAHTDRVEQSQFFSAVRKGFEKEGLDIVVPERVNTIKKSSTVQVAESHRYQPMVPEDGEAYIGDDYEDVGFESPGNEKVTPSHSFNSGLDEDHPPPLPPPLTTENVPPLPPDRKPRTGTLPVLPSPFVPPPSGNSPKHSLSPPPKVDTTSRRSPGPPSPVKLPTSNHPSFPGAGAGGVTGSANTKKSPPPPPKHRPKSTAFGSGLYSNEMTALKEEVQSLKTLCHDLQSEMKSLKSEVQMLREAAGGVPPSPKDSGNKELGELNVEQVQKLLQAMGLSKHCPEFAKEEIDGSILAMCDDSVLEHELHMSTKLDRIKLVQVISGKKSVKRFLQGSYVKFEFKGH